MKRDPLEAFIAKNRADFDDAIPPLKVWADIDRQLVKPIRTKRRVWHALRVAATVALLLTVGGVMGSYFALGTNNDAVALLDDISPEYGELAAFYQNEIARQVQLVNTSNHSDPTIFQDLDQVDETMRELYEALLEAPKGTEQEIVENLIRSYQTKLTILQRVLERINEVEFKNNITNEVTL